MFLRDNEEGFTTVAAAAEHASGYSSSQRGHGQPQSQVEHDPFPPGDKVHLCSLGTHTEISINV